MFINYINLYIDIVYAMVYIQAIKMLVEGENNEIQSSEQMPRLRRKALDNKAWLFKMCYSYRRGLSAL